VKWISGIALVACLAGCDAAGGIECGYERYCAPGEACFSYTTCDDAGWCPFYCADPTTSPSDLAAPSSTMPTDGGVRSCYGEVAPLCCAPGESLCVRGTCSADQWCMIDCCP
jgi:hypothetical protein